jgi:hypothetical protein
MKNTTRSVLRKPRGIGRRACTICGRAHRPVNEAVTRCGSCQAKHQAQLEFYLAASRNHAP